MCLLALDSGVGQGDGLVALPDAAAAEGVEAVDEVVQGEHQGWGDVVEGDEAVRAAPRALQFPSFLILPSFINRREIKARRVK